MKRLESCARDWQQQRCRRPCQHPSRWLLAPHGSFCCLNEKVPHAEARTVDPGPANNPRPVPAPCPSPWLTDYWNLNVSSQPLDSMGAGERLKGAIRAKQVHRCLKFAPSLLATATKFVSALFPSIFDLLSTQNSFPALFTFKPSPASAGPTCPPSTHARWHAPFGPHFSCRADVILLQRRDRSSTSAGRSANKTSSRLLQRGCQAFAVA